MAEYKAEIVWNRNEAVLSTELDRVIEPLRADQASIRTAGLHRKLIERKH
jgi:hypothetical protein